MRRSVFARRLPALLLAGALGWGASPTRAETLTLAQCLRETAEHNPALVQQHYSIERALAARLTLRARALPMLTVGGVLGQLQQEAVGTRSTSVDPATGKKTTVVTATRSDSRFIALGTETLYQPLFDAAIPASYRRGSAALLAEQENFYAVASAQLHLVRTLFLQALYQQKSGEVLREIDRALGANIESVNQLAGAGLVGRANQLTAQVQRANFNPAIVAASGTYRSTLARLLQVMGREPAVHGTDALAGITVAGTLGESLPAFDPVEATRRALDRRPDLRNLRALVRVYTEDSNITRAGYYPLIRLYLNGEAVPETNARNNSPNSVRSSDDVNVTEIRPGIQGNWNIIDTGTVRGGVRAQEAGRDTIAIALARLERAVPADLAVVRARLDDARASTDALRGSQAAAQNSLDTIQAGVAQGINSQLEFLDAQGGLLGIRSGLLAAQLEMSLAHAEFDRVCGNYLQFVDERPASEHLARTAKK